jgi:hypothetical protein
LDAHFFRRLPKKIPAKNNFWGWQSSKKIERTIEDNQPNYGRIGMYGHFWKLILMELKSSFFQLKNKNPRKSNRYFFFN